MPTLSLPTLMDNVAELLDRGDETSALALEPLLAQAEEDGLLGPLLQALIQRGAYARLRDLLCAEGVVDSPSLRRLAAARPRFDEDNLNRAAIAALQAPAPTPYSLLIVPGYSDKAEPLSGVAARRLHRAMVALSQGLAPVILVSGGCVRPAGTPYNEALQMRAHLLQAGLRESQVLVEPYARHTTTNLRNAGRLMRALGLPDAVVVSGYDAEVFSQAFYLAHPLLSTFEARCREELGYAVGSLQALDDEHLIAFTPAAEVDTRDFREPLDS